MSHEIEITTISRTLSPIFFQDPNEEGNITCVGGMNGGVVWLVDVGAHLAPVEFWCVYVSLLLDHVGE